MKFLLFILLFMVYSCGDNNTNNNDCNPKCENWQECSESKCIPKKDNCINNDDCPHTYVCDTESHKCIEDDICRPICNDTWQKCKNKRFNI